MTTSSTTAVTCEVSRVHQRAQRLKLVAAQNAQGYQCALVNNTGIMAEPGVRTDDGFDSQMMQTHHHLGRT